MRIISYLFNFNQKKIKIKLRNRKVAHIFTIYWFHK